MKVCWNIEKELSKKYSIILNHDKIEIDNPDKYHFRRLDYIDRLKKIMSIIKKMFPAPYKIRIADFGCAQGNMSLILAES